MPTTIDEHKLSHLYQQIFHSLDICNTLIKVINAELVGSAFISENAEALAVLLLRILEVLVNHLKLNYSTRLRALANEYESLQSSRPPKEWFETYTELERYLFRISIITYELTPLIKFIYGAKAENNPWGLVAQIDRFCRRLNPQARVIVRPRWAYKYSYLSITSSLHLIVRIAKENRGDYKLGNAISHCLFPEGLRESPNFASLAYPPIAGRNILHMAIWAHEIGHFIDNIDGIRSAKLDEADLHPNIFISTLLASDIEFDIDPIIQELKRVVQIPLDLNAKEMKKEVARKIIAPLFRYRDFWAREIFADLFSVRMCGPAALFTLMQYGRRLHAGLDNTRPEQLSIRRRLKYMLYAYKYWFGGALEVDDSNDRHNDIIDTYNHELECFQSLVDQHNFSLELNNISQESELFRKAYPLFVSEIDRLIDTLIGEVERIANEHGDIFLSQADIQRIFTGAEEILKIIPPDFSIPSDTHLEGEAFSADPKQIPLAVNAGWIEWLHKKKTRSISSLVPYKKGTFEAFDDTNRLLLKSIENAEALQWFNDRKAYGEGESEERQERVDELNRVDLAILPSYKASGGVLHREEITRRIRAKEEESRIVIRPLLDAASQIGTCSLDVRLGNTFLLTKRPSLSKLDLTDIDMEAKAEQITQKLYLPYGKPYVLHPGQFVLGNTLEYISMPDDLLGLVLDRESWGRLGLVLATSFKIIPGYKGCITLSFTNIGNAPIHLYPCSRIGQIVFINLSKGS